MRASSALGVVHSDICSPFENPTWVDNKYFITFVDEFTRIIWLYTIKLKSEVLDVLITLCTTTLNNDLIRDNTTKSTT
jgi:hypothetical protein